jgi:hypothetical protein
MTTAKMNRILFSLRILCLIIYEHYSIDTNKLQEFFHVITHIISSKCQGLMAHNVPAVYDVFASPEKGFAQQRPGLAKCGGV